MITKAEHIKYVIDMFDGAKICDFYTLWPVLAEAHRVSRHEYLFQLELASNLAPKGLPSGSPHDKRTIDVVMTRFWVVHKELMNRIACTAA